MTLAVAILLSIFCSSPAVAGWSTARAQVTQSSEVPQAAAPSTQEPNPESVKPATPTTSPHKRTKKPVKRTTPKKTAVADCDNSNTASSPNNGATMLPDPSVGQTTANQAAYKNCPPEKVVVRHGGTTEPSIQLAGGEQETQKRNETNQMLGSTDENLKKISAIQLNQDQQDTVSQIKQFVVESRAALAAGDLERGHTLAWKAQLLSEDLVKPQK